MISVCIPIYNLDVGPLVEELELQVAGLDQKAEIVLIDDASEEPFRKLNEASCSRNVYVKLPENVGRAKIRNLFLEHAHYDHLLFLDCDSRLLSEHYLSDYVRLIEEHPCPVVCGGSVYLREKPVRDHLLHWRYGWSRVSRAAAKRNRKPNHSFMTNNFLVQRSVLEAHPFDEQLVRYGHEDTLFGFRMKQEGIAVCHEENPVLNAELDNNRVFLEKTEEGIRNLVLILNRLEYPDAFMEEVSLLRAYATLQKRGLTALVRLIFRFSKPVIRRMLLGGRASLRLLDFYKLGFLTTRVRSE
jgi:glycosyltransferase involved in cell wall biosynthesis